MPDLECLAMHECQINTELSKIVGKMLSDFKNVIELDLTQSYLNANDAKNIADGLMRAKRLEVIRLKKMNGLGQGVTPILYNLAFSPRIKCVDMSHLPEVNHDADTCEAIYKLVKITGSLEFLNFNLTPVFEGLTEDFFRALGECKTLRAILIDSHQPFGRVELFGRAVAMNCKKSGCLEILSCVGGFDTSRLDSFLNHLYVSDYDHELWYGD